MTDRRFTVISPHRAELKSMFHCPNSYARIDRAVVFLVAAKRILDAWPADDDKTSADGWAADTASQLLGTALEQLIPILSDQVMPQGAGNPSDLRESGPSGQVLG